MALSERIVCIEMHRNASLIEAAGLCHEAATPIQALCLGDRVMLATWSSAKFTGCTLQQPYGGNC